MPNIPPCVSFFPNSAVNTTPALIRTPSNAIFVELKGEGGTGANVGSIATDPTLGVSANRTTGSVGLSNSGVNALAGGNGISCITDTLSQSVLIEYPAVAPIPSTPLPFVPQFYGGGNSISVTGPQQFTQAFSFTTLNPATYVRLTMRFATGTSNADLFPAIYAQGAVAQPTNGAGFFFVSPVAVADPAFPTYAVRNFDNTPDTFWYPYIDYANFEDIPPSGGSFVPIITLEGTSPTPISTWYVGIGNLATIGGVVYDYRMITCTDAVVRSENAVTAQYAN